MLRLNSKKMLILDNGKPFSMSLNCYTHATYCGCCFYMPFMWSPFSPDSVYSKYTKITFDVTLPADGGWVRLYMDGVEYKLGDGLSAGTHTITTMIEQKSIEYFAAYCDKSGDYIITISNIILE